MRKSAASLSMVHLLVLLISHRHIQRALRKQQKGLLYRICSAARGRLLNHFRDFFETLRNRRLPFEMVRCSLLKYVLILLRVLTPIRYYKL